MSTLDEKSLQGNKMSNMPDTCPMIPMSIPDSCNIKRKLFFAESTVNDHNWLYQ